MTLSRVPSSLGGPSGIGGWLALVVIGLAYTTISIVFLCIMYIGEGSFLYGIILLPLSVLSIICFVLLFRHSRHFPKFLIALLCAYVAVGLLIQIPSAVLTGDWEYALSALAPYLLAAALGIPYMCMSERVKNTFVK